MINYTNRCTKDLSRLKRGRQDQYSDTEYKMRTLVNFLDFMNEIGAVSLEAWELASYKPENELFYIMRERDTFIKGVL